MSKIVDNNIVSRATWTSAAKSMLLVREILPEDIYSPRLTALIFVTPLAPSCYRYEKLGMAILA